MSKKKLILVPSKQMDSNQKKERNEHTLIRLSAPARENLGFNNKVEVWKTGGNVPTVLSIYHAFVNDIKMAKDKYSPEDFKRIAFVTTDVYKAITGKTVEGNIWISENSESTMFGADPEFLIFEGTNVIKAHNVLTHDGPMGSDGAMAEIRPKPSKDVEELVKNMSIIFSDKKYEGIHKYDWMAACYHKDANRDYPVGGHIHIGNNVVLDKNNDKSYFFVVMNKILDELLAIPMTKLDGTEKGSCRRSKCQMANTGHPGYGHFGELRTHDGRLEYRTLSGMWLIHPSVAKAVIGTAKAIVEEANALAENYQLDYIFNNEKTLVNANRLENSKIWLPDFDGWKNVPLLKDMGCTHSSKYMINILNNSTSNMITNKYIKSWYNRLRKMSSYKSNSTWIDGLYEILLLPEKEIGAYGREIKHNWLKDNKFLVNI
jgi:hypothetical protein